MSRAPGPLVMTLLALAGAPVVLSAQQWLPGDSLPLLGRATTQRLTRDADTLLAAWRARAHGVVRMASVVEHGGTLVERVIRADELEVEVYGEAPNRHKQVIVAWRDTSFLPNRVRYHRDHLGIVANDFGGTLRLGDGDEVRDVPHPLSPAGLTHYRFAMGDTLRISGPGGVVRVVAVAVRPADGRAPGTVGTLFLDLDRSALVRFHFTFTPAAYRDPTVEDITVTLENALQEGARWLPVAQRIVIRRGTPLLELPLRTILRADWTIDDYALGVRHPGDRFVGFVVDGLRGPGGRAVWQGALVDRLTPLPAAGDGVAAAQRRAAAALGGRLLDGLPRTRLLARGVSDLLLVDRVSGVVPALGLRRQLGDAATLRARLGLGTSDRRGFGALTLSRPVGGVTLALGAERRMEDVGDVRTGSGVASSLGTLAGGDDLGDWTLVERVGVRLGASLGPVAMTASLDREWSSSVTANFSPLQGSSRANPALGIGSATVTRLAFLQRGPDGEGWLVRGELGAGGATWRRVAVEGRWSAALGAGRLLLGGEAGVGSMGTPGYRDFALGGKHTLPGVPYRAIGGRRMARAEMGWSVPIVVPTPPIPNARGISLPSRLTPFLAAGVAGGERAGAPWRGSASLEPVVGVRLDLWGPLLRLEAGWGWRRGGFGISVDAHPDWWPVL